MTIRLEIAPGDHFDVTVKPFEDLTAADYIRIFEKGPEDPTKETPREVLQRVFGVPERFARIMTPDEIEQVLTTFVDWHKGNFAASERMAALKDMLKDIEQAHKRKATLAEIREALEQHRIFRDRIEVDGRVFIAPERIDIEATAGQWGDLEAAMAVDDEQPEHLRATETETYVKTLSILMREQDIDGTKLPGYPAQGKDETAEEYTVRLGDYLTERRALFMRAPWVDVMGVAAFFFSKSKYCALYTSQRWNLLRELMRQPKLPEPRGFLLAGEVISSFAKPPSTT